MNKFESASIIAGILPNSEEQATAPTNVHMITGEVVERSEDGKALINMDGIVFSGDDSQYVEVDALGGLEDGDTAAILLSGESGKAMAPFALGSAGIIDRVRTTAEDADILAGEAWEVAEAVGQHVWTDDDGLHVTEIPKEEFVVNPTGANQLMNANGTLIRDGEINRTASTPSGYAIYDGQGNAQSNIAAKFAASVQRIGKEEDSHVDISFNAMRMVDKNDRTYLEIRDLRNADGLTDELTETFTADGQTVEFHLSIPAVDANYPVTLNGQPVTQFRDKQNNYFILTTLPARGSTIQAVFRSDSWRAKAYTLGFRSGTPGGMSAVIGQGTASGAFSFAVGRSSATGAFSCALGQSSARGDYTYAEGFRSIARDICAHAEGFSSYALGTAAHAEGFDTHANAMHTHSQNLGTIAGSDCQTAMGKYNVEDTNDTYALIIGNGTALDARSNALTVDWNGNMAAGTYNGVDVAALDSDVTDLGGDVSQLSTDLSSLDGNVSQLSTDLSSLSTDVSGLSTDVSGLSGDVSQLSTDLANLIASLATSTGTITKGSAASSIGSSSLRKSGKVVSVIINEVKLASALASGSTSGTIATIPAGFRPPNTVRLAIAVNTKGNYGNAWAAIGASGGIQIRNTSSLQIPTTSAISFTATYVIA